MVPGPLPPIAINVIVFRRLSGGMSYLQFDGDDHRSEVLVQLLQHDQFLQGQVEEPGGNEHKDTKMRFSIHCPRGASAYAHSTSTNDQHVKRDKLVPSRAQLFTHSYRASFKENQQF